MVVVLLKYLIQNKISIIDMTTNMRKEWFEYVAKIRKKQTRKMKINVSHREAMKLAAQSWPAEKAKLLNRLKRAQRKADKLSKAPQSSKVEKQIAPKAPDQ